jgi:hypothetical protein
MVLFWPQVTDLKPQKKFGNGKVGDVRDTFHKRRKHEYYTV